MSGLPTIESYILGPEVPYFTASHPPPPTDTSATPSTAPDTMAPAIPTSARSRVSSSSTAGYNSARTASATASIPAGSHFDAGSVKLFQRGGGGKGDAPDLGESFARQLERISLSHGPAVEELVLRDHVMDHHAQKQVMRDNSNYFTPEAVKEHFPPANKLTKARIVDPTQLFNPLGVYRDMNSIFGHSGKYNASSHVLPGRGMKANMDVTQESVSYGKQRRPNRPGSAAKQQPVVASAAGPIITHRSEPPASLTGMPLTFFGVSTNLTSGQAAIQKRWMENIGIRQPDPTREGPLSPRSANRPSTAASTSSSSDQLQPITADALVLPPEPQSPQHQPPPFHVPVIPPLPLKELSTSLPQHTWTPSMNSEKPDVHTHEAVKPQAFEFAPISDAAIKPIPSSSSRPVSGTSRAMKAQAHAASASAAATSSRPPSASHHNAAAAMFRPDSATSVGASRSRPITAGRKTSSVRPMTENTERHEFELDMKGLEINLRHQQQPPMQHAATSRPSSSTQRNASSSTTTPMNQYPRPLSRMSQASEEEKQFENAAAVESDYQRWKNTRRPLGSATSRLTSGAIRVSASQTSRPPTGGKSRPTSSTSARGANIRKGGFDPRTSFNPGFFPTNVPKSVLNAIHHATTHPASHLPAAHELMAVDDTDSRDINFHSRQVGDLLTTRARAPFSPQGGQDAHSHIPLLARALQPNSGFQTELVVSHDLLNEFVQTAGKEQPHFYSKNLFWDYKLSEMLRGTEQDGSASQSGSHYINPMIDDDTQLPIQATGEVAKVTDATYPNTYRTLATSFILKQVLPAFKFSTKGTDGTNSTGYSYAADLLSSTLDILHRSIYQPVASLLPPNPPAHLIDPDLGAHATILNPAREDVELEAQFWGSQQMSKRQKRLADVEGSGYAQKVLAKGTVDQSIGQTKEAHTKDDEESSRNLTSAFEFAMSEEGKFELASGHKLFDQLDGGRSASGKPTNPWNLDPHSYAIPFFLSTKYLYESNQILITESEKTSEKILRVEGQIHRIHRRMNVRILRFTFHLWQAYVKMQKQKQNVQAFFSAKQRVMHSRLNSAFLIFHMWRDWSKRQKVKRSFRSSLKRMQLQLKQVSTQIHVHQYKDHGQLVEYLNQIQTSFHALENESRFSAAPVDLFSPMALHMLLERFQGQIAMIASLNYSDLLPLSEAYSRANDLSVEVDLLLTELGRLGGAGNELNEVRQHLLTKLTSLRRREANQEQALMESLLYMSAEDFLFAWVNRHLSEAQSGRKLEDLSDLSSKGDLYLELLRSVAPNVVDNVSKDMLAETQSGLFNTTGGPNQGGHVSAFNPASTSAPSAVVADSDSRIIGTARMVLEVANQLGCRPVISLEEILSHPSHVALLARRAKEQLRSGGAEARAAISSMTRGNGADASVPGAASSSFYSSHPADAGLTPKELGAPVDAQGRLIHERKHMFDELGLEFDSSYQQQKKKEAEASLVASSKSKRSGAQANADIPPAPAHPHLHLCLLATLFLQRPSLPPTATAGTSGSGTFSREAWLESARSRLQNFKAEWDVIQARRDVSLRALHSFLAAIQHMGLEIDVVLERSQRRTRGFDQLRDKMEDLLYQLQKRKGASAVSAAAAAKNQLVKRANISAEVPMYTEIPMGKMMDLFTNKEASLRDYEDFKILLGRHYAELSNIFRHYSTLFTNSAASLNENPNVGANSSLIGHGASVSFAEFIIFIQDCHLLSKRITKGVLHVLFSRCVMSMQELATQSTHMMPYSDADRLEHDGEGQRRDQLLASTASQPTSPTHAQGSARSNAPGGAADMFDPRLAATAGVMDSAHRLRQADFFESLIRLGILKYPQVGSLPERVRRMIEMDVLPNACRLKLDEFRSLLNRDRVKHVFQAHQAELQAIFHHFTDINNHQTSSASASSKKQDGAADTSKKGKMMTKEGFIRMAQESKLVSIAASTASKDLPLSPSTATPSGNKNPFSGLGAFKPKTPATTGSTAPPSTADANSFTELHLINIFNKVLRIPATVQSTMAADEAEMSYPEFLEALGAIAVTFHPDPYLPVQVKLEAFLSNQLLPHMKKAIRRLNQLMTHAGHGVTQASSLTAAATAAAAQAKVQAQMISASK